MGYPMTWQRVLNRNGLTDGDYVNPPQRHAKNCVTDATTGTSADPATTKIARFDTVADRVERYEQAFKNLAGDIRRLEADAVDEGEIARAIATRTGIEPNVVAAVLKEFISV